MVVQKSNIEKNFNLELAAEIKVAEIRIDTDLERSGRASFTLERIRRDYREKFVAEIINMYQPAGWKVKREQGSDPRDGGWDYLSIS
jgi:hypothetical protein